MKFRSSSFADSWWRILRIPHRQAIFRYLETLVDSSNSSMRIPINVFLKNRGSPIFSWKFTRFQFWASSWKYKYRLIELLNLFLMIVLFKKCDTRVEIKSGSGREYHYNVTRIWSGTSQFVDKKNLPGLRQYSNIAPRHDFPEFPYLQISAWIPNATQPVAMPTWDISTRVLVMRSLLNNTQIASTR